MMPDRYYGVGAGFIAHCSGARLDRSMAVQALSRHLATTKNPLASPAEIDLARTCVGQITEAMKASFPQNVEALR